MGSPAWREFRVGGALMVVAVGSEKEEDRLYLGLGFDLIVKEMFGFS